MREERTSTLMLMDRHEAATGNYGGGALWIQLKFTHLNLIYVSITMGIGRTTTDYLSPCYADDHQEERREGGAAVVVLMVRWVHSSRGGSLSVAGRG